MTAPNVSITKTDFQTGSVARSPVGVLAIVSPATQGPSNVPSSYARDDLAMASFGPGELVEFASYTMSECGNPTVLCRATAATAASYGTVDTTGMTGSSVPTAGSAAPADRYDVLVTFVKGGTVGAAGITFTYSLDGGNSTSAPQALPTGSAPITLTIPNFTAGGSPGVSFSLAAGTVAAGDYFRVLTTPSTMNDTDLATSLEAMRVTTVPWEGLLIDQTPGTATVGLVDAWLAALEKVGKFRFALLNTRFKNQAHVGTGTPETEAAYLTALAAFAASSSPSIRCVVGADGALVASTLTGLLQPRPTSLLVAARAMAEQLGVDPAYVALGPAPDTGIADSNGNPAFHDEQSYPNLDQLLLSTLRTVPGLTGVYITNGNVFSTVGSDYVFVQHIRTMNRACELAFQILTKQLGRGVGKKPKDPTTGAVYILERDAMTIEGLVNGVIKPQLKNQVQDVQFALSRTDDLSANSGATVTGSLQIVALAYVKAVKVIAAFAKSISVSV